MPINKRLNTVSLFGQGDIAGIALVTNQIVYLFGLATETNFSLPHTFFIHGIEFCASVCASPGNDTVGAHLGIFNTNTAMGMLAGGNRLLASVISYHPGFPASFTSPNVVNQLLVRDFIKPFEVKPGESIGIGISGSPAVPNEAFISVNAIIYYES